jgi:hypothetical protein
MARKLLAREPGATVANLHNHTLLTSVAEVNTSAHLRSIPADLEPQAVILKRAACSPMKIFLCLSRECQRFNCAVTFTRKDVYNKYAERSADKALDCSNLIQYLSDRHSDDGSLPFDFSLSQDGVLDCVFFVVKMVSKGGSDQRLPCYFTTRNTGRIGMATNWDV